MVITLVEKLLVRALLFVAILMVQLFNQLDDGETDYQVVEKPREPIAVPDPGDPGSPD